MQTALGYRIYAWRIDNGFSQERFGELLGVSARTIQQWECGKSLPSAKTLMQLSLLMDVTTDWLLGLSDDWRRTKTRRATNSRGQIS